MKRLIEKNIATSGLGLALLLLVVVGGASYRSITRLLVTDKWVKHTFVVLQEIESVTSGLKDAERGRRGYIITSDQVFLGTFELGVQAVQQKTKHLKQLTADNPRQQRRLNALQPLLAKRLASLQYSIDQQQQHPLNDRIQVTLTEQDLKLQNQVQKILDEMEAEEKQLLQRRSLESENSVRNTIIVFVVGYSLSFGLLLGVFRLLQQRIRDRQKSEQALQESEFKFRAIFNQTFQFMGLLTPEGILLEVNQTALDFTGVRAEEVIGRPLWEGPWWTSSDDRKQVKAAIERASAGEFVRYEVDVQGTGVSDGDSRVSEQANAFAHKQDEVPQLQVIAIDFSLKPVKDESDRVVLLISEGRDITVRKQAETALCELNAELDERVKQRTAELEAANQLLRGKKQVLEMLATGASLPDVLDSLIRTIEKQSVALICSILLLDADGQTLRHGAAPSLPKDYNACMDRIAIGPCAGSCGTAAYLGQPAIVADIATDPLWVNSRDLALGHGLRACWSQPIISSQGKVLGTFAVYYREPRRPSLKDLQLIETAAYIAGIAIEHKQVEQERTRLITILEASSDYIGIADPQGNALWNNAQMKKFLGLNSNAEMAKLSIPDYHPQWALEVVQNQGLPVAIKDGIWVGETALLHHDGHEIPVSQMIIAHKSSDDSLEYFSTMMHDISNRKRAEQILRESEERFRATFEQAAVGIAHASPDGRFLRFNQKFCDLLGYTHEELLACTFQELTHPDDQEVSLECLRQLLAGEIQTYSLEKRYIHKDSLPIWVNLTVSLVRDPSGKPKYTISVVQDISTLKETQEALLQVNEELELRVQSRTAELFKVNAALTESEERLRLFIENAPSAIAMFDREMRYLATSKCWLLDYNLGEQDIVGRSHYEVFPEVPDRWKKDHQNVLQGKVIKSEEDFFVRSDGKTDWIRCELHPWLNSNRGVGGIIMFTEVITHRKEAERKLRQANAELARSNQELEQFAYIASHDLREPLRKIKSYTDLLVKRYQGKLDDKADRYIAYITDGAVRMQALITDLLTYSRVGRGEISLELTDLGTVLDRVLSDLSTAIRESNAVIKTDSLPTVKANPLQMGQLLQNLIANAIKFRGKQPPQIQIRAVHSGKTWTISVQDNGIGIEPEYKERIFVIFQRLHTKDEYSGTGIGLAVCKKIVERHGGQIWLESELGQGTNFFFTIPVN